MAVYAYTAISGTMEAIKGTISADSPRNARDQLRAQGLRVRDIIEQVPGISGNRIFRYIMGRQSGRVTGLLQEIATLLAAGIPLLEAMDTITRQHTGSFRRAIMLLRDHVAGGGQLTEAMSLQPELFDDLCVNLVEVGENAGTLENSLAALVDFRRRTARLKNRVAGALMYPCIVMTVGLAVSIFLMTFVTPKLLGVLVDSGKSLPAATVAVRAVSDFLISWRWLLLSGLVGAAFGISSVLRTARGSMAWHRLQLRLPLIGDLVRKQAIARMAMVMATLLKSDVVFVRSLQIARNTVRNGVLREALSACEDAVCAGNDISEALERTGAFPPLVIQVFAVGQASGRLEEMLDNLANDYDTQVEIASGRLTTLLEPIMMILLAIMVGFIAMATILPILEAGDVL